MTRTSTLGGGGGGINFSDPRRMIPVTVVSNSLNFYDTSGTQQAGGSTQFFTGIAAYGVQDTTDWVANTFKTIYSHTGFGNIAAMIACTAGGAETTTFELTIDGTLSTITVTNATGERAALLTSVGSNADFTTAAQFDKAADSGLNAGTTTFQTGAMFIPAFIKSMKTGIPLLEYKLSCLIRMKHSASITNSTATSYSGVIVRKGIAS